jgi:hypothetical protein
MAGPAQPPRAPQSSLSQTEVFHGRSLSTEISLRQILTWRVQTDLGCFDPNLRILRIFGWKLQANIHFFWWYLGNFTLDFTSKMPL